MSELPQESKAGPSALLKGACLSVIVVMGPIAFASDSNTQAANEVHATSSYIRSVIAAGLPKFTPPRAQPSDVTISVPAAPSPAGVPSDVVALPAFTITEAKLPSARQTMTYSGWTQPLVDKYMGPADGIDRGILNKYTLAQLWAKLPIIGKLPFIGPAAQMTLAERALDDAGANNPVRTKPIE